MQDDLRGLARLQRVDDELAALEAEAAAVPGRRRELAARCEATAARLVEARSQLEEAELDRRRLEGEVNDQEQLIERLEKQQFQVKSNDAYSALLRELEHAREAISERETAILEAMETIDARATAVREAEEADRVAAAEVAAEEKAIALRDTALQEELTEVGARREEVASRVGRTALGRYDRIHARHGRALVVVSGEICDGCKIGIPAQWYVKLLAAEEFVTCGSCHRILVHERVIAAGAPAGGEDADPR